MITIILISWLYLCGMILISSVDPDRPWRYKITAMLIWPVIAMAILYTKCK